MDNPFLLPVEEYQRAVSPVRDWMRQTATYASIMLDKPFEQCLAHLEKKFKAKEVGFQDPSVVHFRREVGGDKKKYEMRLSRYIGTAIRNGDILTPTGTTYCHPTVKVSAIVEYLDVNVKERNRYKKLSQKNEAEEDWDGYIYNDNQQKAAKTKNNAASGNFVADGSVIKNPSGHTTLTSTTRSISSLSNASNERVIEGNRHYYNPQIALNNAVSIVTESDYGTIDAAMQTFGLVYPSEADTLACIRRSLDLYSVDTKGRAKIREFIAKLNPAQRAAIVYTGDLYHVRRLNEGFVYQLFQELSTRGDETPLEDPVAAIWGTNEQILNFACQINVSMLAGKGKKYAEKLTFPEQCILANTCKHIEAVIEKYRLFFKAFFLTRNSPCTISTIGSMIRRSVVLSDTDSTMFSVDNWVKWYFDKKYPDEVNHNFFNDEGYAVGGTMMFIATQAIAHILALFSANMNVEKKRLFTLAMKPEFVFPVFALTSVAKHYYTAIKIKEGNVYPDIKMEIKGVHMKDSTLPHNITKGAADEMEDIIRTLMAGTPISWMEKIEKAAALEREIIASLERSETKYLKRTRIKEAASYTQDPEKSPYRWMVFWNEIFGPKYGDAPPPTYNAFYIPLAIDNKTDMKRWYTLIEDEALRTRLQQYLARIGVDKIAGVPIPADALAVHGIMPELACMLDTKRVVLSLTKSYRNILESIGFFPKANRMVHEHFVD